MTEQACPITAPDLTPLETVSLQPENKVTDYQEAMRLAKNQAGQKFEEYMLLSWYDQDRDVESPPHATECGNGRQKDGYIRYGLSHGARLKVDIEDGRFVFLFAPVEW